MARNQAVDSPNAGGDELVTDAPVAEPGHAGHQFIVLRHQGLQFRFVESDPVTAVEEFERRIAVFALAPRGAEPDFAGERADEALDERTLVRRKGEQHEAIRLRQERFDRTKRGVLITMQKTSQSHSHNR